MRVLLSLMRACISFLLLAGFVLAFVLSMTQTTVAEGSSATHMHCNNPENKLLKEKRLIETDIILLALQTKVDWEKLKRLEELRLGAEKKRLSITTKGGVEEFERLIGKMTADIKILKERMRSREIEFAQLKQRLRRTNAALLAACGTQSA